MNERRVPVPRRAFLHACAVSGAGLAIGLHRFATADESNRKDIVAGLDLGISDARVAVAERLPDDTIKLLGVGVSSGCGPERVREPLANAEALCRVKIRSVVLAVAGQKMGPDTAWSDGLDTSTATKVGRKVVESLRKRERTSYCEGGDGTLIPIEVARWAHGDCWHFVPLAGALIEHCEAYGGIKVERAVSAPVASAEAVLDAEQKRRGALVIDMGHFHTGYAVHAGGSLVASDTLNIAVAKLADDLSLDSLRLERAPWLKQILLGDASALREGSCEMLSTIVYQRVWKTFEQVNRLLKGKGLRPESLVAGIHLTGGGLMLPGVCELAEEVFGTPTSRARPKGIAGFSGDLANPHFACSMGLVKLAARKAA